jgi:methylase of polypeptide subunit release factors
MEIGADQGAAVTALAERAGLRDVVVHRDYAGLPRVLIGRL